MENQTPQSNPINVMLVEDDQIYRESIQDLLNDAPGLSCRDAFETCEEAIEAIKNNSAPEILLLDIDLPGMSGVEGIKHIKAISPASKIIMLTVFDDDDHIFDALCQGATGYLLKSSTSENVARYINDVLAGGAAMSPTIAARVLSMFTQYAQPRKEYGLTEREREILQLLVNGTSKKHIADHLFISLHTVDTHLKNIYAKLHVHSQIDVVAKALKERLI